MERNGPYNHLSIELDLKLDPLLDFQLGEPKTSLFIVASLSWVFYVATKRFLTHSDHICSIFEILGNSSEGPC